jgi:hypothetical protein
MFFVLILFTLYIIGICIAKGLYIHLDRRTTNHMESYITSKKPTSVAEVEKLIKDYDYRGGNWL